MISPRLCLLCSVFLVILLAGTHAFVIVWNVPTSQCHAFGAPLYPEDYGVITNKDEETFGHKMNLFFHLGKFPKIDTSNNVIVNGGVPQVRASLFLNSLIKNIILER